MRTAGQHGTWIPRSLKWTCPWGQTPGEPGVRGWRSPAVPGLFLETKVCLLIPEPHSEKTHGKSPCLGHLAKWEESPGPGSWGQKLEKELWQRIWGGGHFHAAVELWVCLPPVAGERGGGHPTRKQSAAVTAAAPEQTLSPRSSRVP